MANFYRTGHADPSHMQAFGNANRRAVVYTHPVGAAAAAAGDKIYLDTLTAGLRVIDFENRVITAVAGLSVNVGHEPADSSAPVANASAFFAARSIAGAGAAAANIKPILFDGSSRLVATVTAGTLAAGQELVFVYGGEVINAK